MNTKSFDLLVVLIVVCIIQSTVYCIENNEWINNQVQSDNNNVVLQELQQPDIQNFISAPDAIAGFNSNAINDTTVDYNNNQFYPFPFSVNDVVKQNVGMDNEIESGVKNVSRRPQITSGFQMLRRSVATMVEKIQYFIQSIWNYFTVGKFCKIEKKNVVGLSLVSNHNSKSTREQCSFSSGFESHSFRCC